MLSTESRSCDFSRVNIMRFEIAKTSLLKDTVLRESCFRGSGDCLPFLKGKTQRDSIISIEAECDGISPPIQFIFAMPSITALCQGFLPYQGRFNL